MADELLMYNSDLQKGHVPLVHSANNVQLHVLRDSKLWHQRMGSNGAPTSHSTPPLSRSPSLSPNRDDQTDGEATDQHKNPPQSCTGSSHCQNSSSGPSRQHPSVPRLPPETINAQKHQREWDEEGDDYDHPHCQQPPPACRTLLNCLQPNYRSHMHAEGSRQSHVDNGNLSNIAEHPCGVNTF